MLLQCVNPKNQYYHKRILFCYCCIVTMKSFLCRLANCNKNSFKGIIKHADKKDLREFISFVSEVMHKKIPIPKAMIRLIRNNRHVMRHLISPSYSLRSKQKYLIQKGGAGLGNISRGLARAAEDVGQAVGQGARAATRARAAEMLAAGQGSGVQLRSGAQALSRRQAELVRAPPQQLARERAIAQARGAPSSISTRQSSRIADMPRGEFNMAARIRRQPVIGIAASRASKVSFRTPSRTATDVEFFPRSRTVSDIDFFPRDYAARTASDIDFFRGPSTRDTSLRSMSSAGQPSLRSYVSPKSWQEASRVPSSISAQQSSRIAGIPRIEFNRAARIRNQPVMG